MYRKLISLMITVLLLGGCAQPTPPSATEETPHTTAVITADTSATTEVTEIAETAETTVEPTETTVEPTETTAEPTETTAEPTETTAETEPAHSDLFISYVTQDEMVRYFNEVCLDAEFVNSGNATVLQRWEDTIYYEVLGDYTPEDIAKIEELAAWLNTVEGFPGMMEAVGPDVANLSIYFCSQQELIDRMGENHYNSDGAVTFWYTDDIIYTGTICVRSDLDQTLRNSVILEEIYNGLGPIQDTNLRSESIIYAGFSQPQALHPIDRVILQLLYHPSLACGMDITECEAAIRTLYY